eukprot:COSAG02_NODE_155_length_33066_cov_32.167562_13_plen_36_part_00
MDASVATAVDAITLQHSILASIASYAELLTAPDIF